MRANAARAAAVERLHMGELTTDEVLVARAAIPWANSQQEERVPLTEKQISKLWSDAHNDTSDRMAHQVLVRLVEAEHGITPATLKLSKTHHDKTHPTRQ